MKQKIDGVKRGGKRTFVRQPRRDTCAHTCPETLTHDRYSTWLDSLLKCEVVPGSPGVDEKTFF